MSQTGWLMGPQPGLPTVPWLTPFSRNLRTTVWRTRASCWRKTNTTSTTALVRKPTATRTQSLCPFAGMRRWRIAPQPAEVSLFYRRLAIVEKVEDGKIAKRIMFDLKQSRGTSTFCQSSRVVLPRLTDHIQSLLERLDILWDNARWRST